MSGYYNYSMSCNAVSAYKDGEKPYSKWFKYNILFEIKEYFELNQEEAKKVSKIPLSELKNTFLAFTCYHHTSNHYNKTDFYKFVPYFGSKEELLSRVDSCLESMKEYKKSKKPKKEESTRKVYAVCTVDIWTGTRKHPKKENYTALAVYDETTINEGDEIIEVKQGKVSIYFDKQEFFSTYQNPTIKLFRSIKVERILSRKPSAREKVWQELRRNY